MTRAKTILNMIEKVDPDDTGTLNEIDARFWCYLNNKNPEELFKTGFNVSISQWYYVFYCSSFFELGGMLYTRSRDALKAIRPENEKIRITKRDYIITKNNCTCIFFKKNTRFIGNAKTEELAELSAIIQAIEYIRNI